MTSLRGRVSTAAGWSLAIRAIERVIGIGSTLVFARLLAPSDFGVIAMGTSLLAIINTVTEFGFAQALIQSQRADDDAFDTVLSLNVLTSLVVAVVLLGAIPAAQAFYQDPRVGLVLGGLAAISFVASWRSVGLVARERALEFKPIFVVMTSRKIAAAAVGIGAAIVLRDYRALLLGLFVGAIVEVAASYWLAPRQIRFTLSRTRDLLRFSIWWLLGQGAGVLNQRGRDIIVGSRLGGASLGQYAVALELAMLPVNELVVPLTRALFPGYVEMRGQTGRLYSAFMRAWGAIAFLALPSAVGIACLSNLITAVVLGPQWTGVAELLGPLAASAAVAALGYAFSPLLLAKHGSKSLFVVTLLGTLVALPTFGLVLLLLDLRAAIIAATIVSAVMTMAVGVWLARGLGGRALDYAAALLRPAVASFLMGAALVGALAVAPMPPNTLWAALALVTLVFFGAAVYGLASLALWMLAGRPQAAESELAGVVIGKWRERRTRARPSAASTDSPE